MATTKKPMSLTASQVKYALNLLDKLDYRVASVVNGKIKELINKHGLAPGRYGYSAAEPSESNEYILQCIRSGKAKLNANAKAEQLLKDAFTIPPSKEYLAAMKKYELVCAEAQKIRAKYEGAIRDARNNIVLGDSGPAVLEMLNSLENMLKD